MRLFIPIFLLLSVFALALVYHKPFRTLVKKHAAKLVLTVLAVAVLLFALFSAMSVSTWRLF